MNSLAAVESVSRRVPLVDRFVRWLDSPPHPLLACEISATQVAVARGSRGNPGIEAYGVAPLPEGAVVPSPVELNVGKPEAVREALRQAFAGVPAGRSDLCLLVPDPVVRVFLLHFDTFPRRAEEAVPLLRWRLKKSVPFDVEDTVVSYLQQPGGGPGVDICAAVARQRIIRQYEELVEAAGFAPGVVLGSTLATLPLVKQSGPTLLARMIGTTLTTIVAREETICVYRCSEMSENAARLEARALLDEIYPVVAFYQDTWHENIQQVRLAGLGERFQEFRAGVESDLGCPVAPLDASPVPPSGTGRLAGNGKTLLDHQLDGLVGWMLNRGA